MSQKKFDPNIEERGFKGVWIPRELYLNPDLSWTEKILLVEIDSLDKGDGCWASNEHFAGFLGLTERGARDAITKIRKKGYIIDRHFDGRKRYISAQFKLVCKEDVNQTDRKVDDRLTENCQSQSENSSHSRSTEQNNRGSSAPNNTMNNTSLDFSSEKSKQSSYEEEETYSVACDDENNPVPEQPKKKKSQRKDKIALGLIKKFQQICENRIHKKPVVGNAGYFLVLKAMNEAGLSEKQIEELFDDWFDEQKPENELIQITRALSYYQINKWKADNDIE